MKISLFERASSTKPIDEIEVIEFINNVKYGEWRAVIEPIRNEPDKVKRTALKEQVPAVTVSGTFMKRNQNDIIKHSGIIAIDIDGFNDKKPIESDVYTYACFRSASGNGLCVLVKVNPEKHKESFRFLQQHYYNTYGITIDPAPQNVASLRFVSFDPELFLNDKSKTSKTLAEPKAKASSLPIIISSDKVGEYVREVVQRGLNIAEQYEDYLRCGFAIANGFGEAGRDYFHAISSVSNKYNSIQADRQYSICLKGANKSGVTVGTFYFFLKKAGINIQVDNDTPLFIAAMGKKSRRKKEAIVDQLVKMENISAESASKFVDDVFSRDDITLKTISADPERLIQSLTQWLKQNHHLKKNSITKKYEEHGLFNGTPFLAEISRERMNTIYLRARAIFNTPHVTFDLTERIIESDFTEEYNPLKDYIEVNRYRNSTGQIDMLIKSINTHTPHADVYIRKWVISIIAAVNGYPVRSVLALCGAQNTGKSEWFRRLLPFALGKYYGESKLDAGKDDALLMCQKLILCDDEMGGKSKHDEKLFKELTSKNIFTLRAPYGRGNEDYKRLSVLCGTSNTMDIINDPTGNTRILPIDVISIDHELYNSINKDELFIECVRAYENGDEWRLTREELLELNITSDEFKGTNYERELILKFFRPPNEGDYVERLTATDIKNSIEEGSKQIIRSMKLFGIELKKIFGKSKSRSVNGISMYIYEVVRVGGNNNGYHHNPYSSPIIDPPYLEPQLSLDQLDTDVF